MNAVIKFFYVVCSFSLARIIARRTSSGSDEDWYSLSIALRPAELRSKSVTTSVIYTHNGDHYNNNNYYGLTSRIVAFYAGK